MGARKSVDMAARKTDTCRTCKAAVIFVQSAKTGKPMILDAKPKKGIVTGIDVGVHYGEQFMFEPPGEDGIVAIVVDVYTDHHATCPGAAAWAGRNRKNPPADPIDPVIVQDGPTRGHAKGIQ